MSKRTKKRRLQIRRRHANRAIGAPPGQLTPPPDASPSVVRGQHYNVDEVQEFDSLEDRPQGRGVTWIDVVGLQDAELLATIGQEYGVHALALEDICNLHQRPKFEAYDENTFVVARMARLTSDTVLDVEQISFLLHGETLITFQEREGDVFEDVRKRIQSAKGQVRKRNAAYLLYALLDALVDSLFPVMDFYADRLDALEDSIFNDPQPADLQSVHDLRGELVAIRRSISPLRDVVAGLSRADGVDQSLQLHLRDCGDHAIQLAESVETHRDHASSLLDGYLSVTGNRTNDVMKVLTIYASIFMPLSFFAGLYGMNFDTSLPYNLPELSQPYGYPMLLAFMAAIAMAMLTFFRRKGWL